ncbi:ribonuclease HI [Poseidonocella pacifica]|uniref:Ribonuclease H n=1 Tax=Poseidonocella pacifica TaxID=871651 RepID=A0A1I0X8A6_9RHOB|nr:ribonuclease HI [Poseidonocella pacifica]SFA96548.1 ribonuclease HI [Poseidonocella pacifica]
MPNIEITIHTDGSCIGNPGPGGYAAVLRRLEDGSEIKKRIVSGCNVETTNNRMELMAAVEGLKALRADETARITILSDSQYLVNGMTKWLPKWQASGWRKAGGKPVGNSDLWHHLIAASSSHDVRWVWVRGHRGNHQNKEADRLASSQAHNANARAFRR